MSNSYIPKRFKSKLDGLERCANSYVGSIVWFDSDISLRDPKWVPVLIYQLESSIHWVEPPEPYVRVFFLDGEKHGWYDITSNYEFHSIFKFINPTD